MDPTGTQEILFGGEIFDTLIKPAGEIARPVSEMGKPLEETTRAPNPEPSNNPGHGAQTAKANRDGSFTDSVGRVRRGSTGGDNAGKRITPKQREAERDASGRRCIYCGRETTDTPGRPNSSQGDHIQPKAGDTQGGPPGNNSPGNVGNSCATCNSSKSNHPVWEWIKNTFGMSGGGGPIAWRSRPNIRSDSEHWV